MTRTEHDAVVYAMKFSAYCGGSHYGQDGGAGPAPRGLTAEQASYVRAAVSRGMNVATAAADDDGVTAEHHESELKRTVIRAERFAGLDANTMWAAFRAGHVRVKAIRSA